MALTVTTDHAAITALLDKMIATDPVRGTLLGTIRLSLTETAWCAHSADGAQVAVRSSAAMPVVPAGHWSEADVSELVALLTALPTLAGVSGDAELIEGIVERLPKPVSLRMPQRLFRLDELVPPPVASGYARRAAAADRHVVLDFYRAFGVEGHVPRGDVEQSAEESLRTGGCWLWLDESDAPVSLAARRPVLFGSARVGPVYTPPEQRGHGYGSAVTAATTRDILDDGAIPVLFTDLTNPVSNAIYPRLGYYPVEDRLVVRFA